MQKIAVCYVYILRAITAGRCRERRYADHVFIQMYLRMHHFVVRFSSPKAALTEILRTFLDFTPDRPTMRAASMGPIARHTMLESLCLKYDSR